MDSPGHSLTEREVQPNDEMSNHEPVESNDISTVSDESNGQRFNNESEFQLSHNGQVRRLIEENLAAAGANSKAVHCNCCWVVTDESEARSLDSHSAVDVDRK